MSKYRYNFHVSTGYVGSNKEETIDLVDDWNEDESELDIMDEHQLEKHVEQLYNVWLWNNIDGGFWRIDE